MKFIFTLLTAVVLTGFSSTAVYACPACDGKKSETSSTNQNPKKIREDIQSAIQSGESVLLAFHSKSCATCKVQKPRLEKILKDSKYENLKVFLLNYESANAERAELKVHQPSTLVLFNKGEEVKRLIGQTDAEKLKIFLERAI